MPLKTYTLTERPRLEDEFERLAEVGWPRFLRQRDELGVGRHWPRLFTTFKDFQLPETMVGILEHALDARQAGRRPTALSALAAITEPERRGQGLSGEIIKAMAALARQHGLDALVAPVRPTLKSRYPLTPMERYVRWTRTDGAPLDPWMRVHWRLGAEIVRVVPRTLVIVGTVVQWEDWTDMAFPDSGPYAVPGALQPVMIDRARDEGRYEDPNVWMHHRLA